MELTELELKRQHQKEADRKYRLSHPDRCKQKDKKRYQENKERERARNSSYYMRNRETQRIRHRNNRHKITSEWYDAKMLEQQNQCAVCGKSFEKTPHIDHNHACCPSARSCGKCHRGLLCDDCNLGLGRFKDSIEILSRAIQYLEKYSASR